MHKKLCLSVAMAMLISGGALGQDAASYPTSADQILPAAISDTQEFATKAGISGMFEIQSSQLALTKTQNADIAAFAQMMINDHTKAAAELMAAATAQGNTTVPSDLDQPSNDMMAQLAAASGADFDKLYVEMQTKGHADAVGLFGGYAMTGAAGPLKDYAVKTLPTLKMHYDHVLALAG